MDKKTRSIRNEKLNASGASETEEQRKERLRKKCEKDSAEGEPKKYRRKRKSSQNGKTMSNSAWPLSKRGDENEFLERKLRLEKVVAANSSGWPRTTMVSEVRIQVYSIMYR